MVARINGHLKGNASMEKLSISFRRCLWVIFAAFFLVACEENELDDYGLSNIVAMEIKPENMSRLRSSAYAKTPVPGSVRINDAVLEASISYSGATSIDDLKKSFEVILKEPYEGRRVYRLNAMPGDNSALHALMAYHVYELAGFDMPRLEPTAVWLNDEYAGLYLLQEKYDEPFFEKHSKHPISLYQAEGGLASMENTHNMENAYSAKIGTKEFGDLKRLIELIGEPPGSENRAQLEKILDVENILNYMAVTGFINSWDGIRNNFYFLRTTENPKFCILPWDLDKTFSKSNGIEDGEIFMGNSMMRRFFFDDEPYRTRYRGYFLRIAKRANAANLGAYLEFLREQIKEAYAADRILSGDEISFDRHVEILKRRFEETDELLAPVIR